MLLVSRQKNPAPFLPLQIASIHMLSHTHQPSLASSISTPQSHFCCSFSPNMENTNSHRQLANMKKGLFDQGYLDEQFHQLEELQDDVSPNFVEEVVTLFFRDSSRVMANIDHALDKCPQDFGRLDAFMHQLKGSTSSIGAARMKNECTLFREYCDKGNLEGCRRSFQKVKKEHATLRQKLETYFQLLRQVGPMEKATRSSN